MRIFFVSMLISWFITIDQLHAQNLASASTTLSPTRQRIVVIAALTAKGNLTNLQPALSAGLDAGLTVNEIKKVLVHLYAYCGFPRSIRGLQTVKQNPKPIMLTHLQSMSALPIPINLAYRYHSLKRLRRGKHYN